MAANRQSLDRRGLGRTARRVALLTLLAASFASSSQALEAWDETAYARARVNLRAEPSATASILRRIPRGGRFEVATCEGGWCLGIFRGRQGYVAERYLSAEAPRRLAGGTSQGGRGYINSRGVWVPSPSYSPSGPPAGASARCCDGTYSYSRSRRGTCSHHGGVCQWLH